MSLKNFWNLTHKAQEQIKADHPTTPLYEYRVQGQFNINYKTDTGGLAGDGFPVDTTVRAISAQDAANRVAQAWVARYQNVTDYCWLNAGPSVIPTSPSPYDDEWDRGWQAALKEKGDNWEQWFNNRTSPFAEGYLACCDAHQDPHMDLWNEED